MNIANLFMNITNFFMNVNFTKVNGSEEWSHNSMSKSCVIEKIRSISSISIKGEVSFCYYLCSHILKFNVLMYKYAHLDKWSDVIYIQQENTVVLFLLTFSQLIVGKTEVAPSLHVHVQIC